MLIIEVMMDIPIKVQFVIHFQTAFITESTLDMNLIYNTQDYYDDPNNDLSANEYFKKKLI